MNCAKSRRVGSHMSFGQKKMLIEFLENNTKLNTGKFDSTFSFNDAKLLWQNLADKLNSVPGACKDWQGWRKAWYDIKGSVKTKRFQIRKHQTQFGGRIRSNFEKTPLENRILTLILPNSAIDDANVVETSINTRNLQNTSPATLISKSDDTTQIEIINTENVEVPSTTPVVEISTTSLPPNTPRKRKLRAQMSLEYSKKELDMKSAYYEKKIRILERIAKAKEDVAKSLSSIAQAAITVALAVTRDTDDD